MRAKGMGLSNNRAVPSVYSFGDLFDAAAIRALRKTVGLNAVEFARQVGIRIQLVYTRARHGRPTTALKVRSWRAKIIANLLSSAPKAGYRAHYGYGAYRTLRTFFPKLRDKCQLLLQPILIACRDYLKANRTAGLGELQKHLCEQAMLETADMRPGKLFVKFLPWAPEVLPFFDLDRLSGQEKIPALALEIIAAYFGTTAGVVVAAMDWRAEPIPPKEMRLLISSGPAPTPKPPRERTKKEESKKQYFIVGRAVEDAIPVFEDLMTAKAAVPKSIRLRKERLAKAGFTEEQIEAAIWARTAIVAARHFIAAKMNLSFEATAEYHRAYKAATAANSPTLQPWVI